jgi:hypothetical protein
MNFRKVNNITGWVILLIATATYTLTREATASFWDCGEFIACANEIGIPHPPGSPLFTMLGRLFILVFSGGNAANAASSVNLMSAVASGFCILFLFWTITHFARKMFVNHGESLTTQQIFTVMASGVVGALAYTFSDTFWFSAVEGEVYALSSFFTALIIWAMLKWEHAYELAKDVVERNRADRWIVFIFFMIGLSITVHLLNLLTVPAIVMIYFYKKYTPTVRKSIFAFLFSCVLTGAVLFGMVYAIPRTSALFDRVFVNGFGLPFFTGFTIFFILLGVGLWFLLKVARDKGMPMLRLAVWCFVFIMIGYSTYVTTLIRSKANPGIDMSNVDNPMTLASYFAREQYGSAPLLYGRTFASQPAIEGNYYKFKEGRMKWGALGNKYVELGREQEYEFDASQLMVFPRIWDESEQQDHLQFYVNWLNKSPYQDATGRVAYDPPITYGDNLNFFFRYQMGVMYWRYFMWNFAGRQNDLQGFGTNLRDGNWQTGISFIDKQMLGDQSTLPDSLKENKANNKLYLLPFLLGILGCVYHFIKKKNDWVVNFLLFFFTGIAIGLYLNMPGNQPRERDYAFVGSFYAFAVWIGLAVTALVKLTKEIKQNSFNTIVYGSVLTFLISVLSTTYLPGPAVIKTSLMITAVYAILAAGLPALLKAISSKGANERIINIAAAVICMLAPILMANQEWDDHDRSKKTLARDDAKNYLESCAQNAILFCFGDNDTYPLWYAQEVEKVRPDIRIINTSLLGIDWYINQLRYKINQSDSVDVIWGPDKIIGDKLQYLQYVPSEKAGNDYYDLYRVMSGIGNQTDPRTIPIKRFKVPVDTVLARKNGTLNDEDVAATEMQFEVPNRALTRDQLIILNIIATNQWKRPIYFTSPTQVGLGLTDFLRRDGLTSRLIPVKANTDINVKPMYDNMMKKFANGHADVKGVYFDEENRRHLYTIRQSYADLARELLAKGEKDSAKAVVLKSDQLIPDTNVPYAIPSRYEMHNRASLTLMEAAYQSGATELAKKISNALNKDFNQHMEYIASLGDMTKKQLEDILMNYSQQRYMEQMQQQQGGQPNRQADAYLNANLSRDQSGLASDMLQLFNLMQYVKRTDTDNNQAAKDSASKKLESALQTLKADSDKPKGKADSPKTTKPK